MTVSRCEYRLQLTHRAQGAALGIGNLPFCLLGNQVSEVSHCVQMAS